MANRITVQSLAHSSFCCRLFAFSCGVFDVEYFWCRSFAAPNPGSSHLQKFNKKVFFCVLQAMHSLQKGSHLPLGLFPGLHLEPYALFPEWMPNYSCHKDHSIWASDRLTGFKSWGYWSRGIPIHFSSLPCFNKPVKIACTYGSRILLSYGSS